MHLRDCVLTALRIDLQELNQKTAQLYQNVTAYWSTFKNVHCCENSHTSESGKSIQKSLQKVFEIDIT